METKQFLFGGISRKRKRKDRVLGFPNITMGLHRGAKERGCDFKLSQEGQDLCASASGEQLIFKTRVSTRPWILKMIV